MTGRRIIVCYLAVILLLAGLLWWASDPAAGIILLFPMIAFIPSLLAIFLLFLPIERHFADGQAARLPPLLAAGFGAPMALMLVLTLLSGGVPSSLFGFAVWGMMGAAWAFIWWVSGCLFPPAATPDE